MRDLPEPREMTTPLAIQLIGLVPTLATAAGRDALTDANQNWRAGCLSGMQAQFCDPSELSGRHLEPGAPRDDYDTGWRAGYNVNLVMRGVPACTE